MRSIGTKEDDNLWWRRISRRIRDENRETTEMNTQRVRMQQTIGSGGALD